MMGMRTKVRTCTQMILGIVLTLLSAQSYAVERKVFYHNNLLGSPVAATDESGNLCWREDYRPYGEKIRNEDQGCGLDDNVVGYTGHVHDGDIGLTYMQARYYDPVVGRFMGVDPVGFRISKPSLFNRYSYGKNSPYSYKDPDGKLFAAAIPFALEALELAYAAIIAISAIAAVDEITGLPSASTVFNEKQQDAEEKTKEALDKIRGKSKPGRGTKGRSTQWDTPSDNPEEDMNKDFGSLNPSDVEEYPDGVKVGKLPNGDVVVANPVSSSGKPSLEIQSAKNKKNREKFRYGDLSGDIPSKEEGDSGENSGNDNVDLDGEI